MSVIEEDDSKARNLGDGKRESETWSGVKQHRVHQLQPREQLRHSAEHVFPNSQCNRGTFSN